VRRYGSSQLVSDDLRELSAADAWTLIRAGELDEPHMPFARSYVDPILAHCERR
jgi:hypothetical protein